LHNLKQTTSLIHQRWWETEEPSIIKAHALFSKFAAIFITLFHHFAFNTSTSPFSELGAIIIYETLSTQLVSWISLQKERKSSRLYLQTKCPIMTLPLH